MNGKQQAGKQTIGRAKAAFAQFENNVTANIEAAIRFTNAENQNKLKCSDPDSEVPIAKPFSLPWKAVLAPLVYYKFFTESELAEKKKISCALLRDSAFRKHAFRLSSCCCKFMHFSCSHSSEDDEPDTKHAISLPRRCESRLCPRCARIRSYVVRNRLLKSICQFPKTKRNKLMLLTLTLRGNRVLTRDRVLLLNKCTRKLINCFYPKSSGCGAVSVVEVGKNKNLHAHCLVFGPYISQKAISQKWRELTKDSFVVDIRSAYQAQKAIWYILKYISKVPKFAKPETYLEFAQAFHRVRRLHTYGIYYNNLPLIKQEFVCPICRSRYVGFHFGHSVRSNCPIFYRQFENYRKLKRTIEVCE